MIAWKFTQWPYDKLRSFISGWHFGLNIAYTKKQQPVQILKMLSDHKQQPGIRAFVRLATDQNCNWNQSLSGAKEYLSAVASTSEKASCLPSSLPTLCHCRHWSISAVTNKETKVYQKTREIGHNYERWVSTKDAKMDLKISPTTLVEFSRLCMCT